MAREGLPWAVLVLAVELRVQLLVLAVELPMELLVLVRVLRGALAVQLPVRVLSPAPLSS